MHIKQKQKIWNSSTNGDLVAIGWQFTAKWHKLLASLFLYRHVTRIQPADFIAKRPNIDKLAQTDSDCLQPLVNLPERLVWVRFGDGLPPDDLCSCHALEWVVAQTVLEMVNLCVTTWRMAIAKKFYPITKQPLFPHCNELAIRFLL